MFASFQDRMPWLKLMQRPAFFFPVLSATPYVHPPSPGEQGGATPSRATYLPTAKAVVGVFPAIVQEFTALMAAAPLTFRDTPSDDPALTAGRDPNGWRRLVFLSRGEWNETACSLMPTVCDVLRQDSAIAGQIPPEKVARLNEQGGWKPSPGNAWLNPDVAGGQERHPLDIKPFKSNSGKVIDQTVSVLRLAPGARLLPHCGSTNGRLNIHFGLVIPEGCKLRVADELRDWHVAQPIIFGTHARAAYRSTARRVTCDCAGFPGRAGLGQVAGQALRVCTIMCATVRHRSSRQSAAAREH